jgi:hypothetical protein
MNIRKILFVLLAGIAFVSTPSIVYADAYQISPNPNYGNINIFTNEAFNSQSFDNYYGIWIEQNAELNNDKGGTLNNYDMITIYTGGFLNNNYGATLNNYFTLDNMGELTNNYGATLNNYLTSL